MVDYARWQRDLWPTINWRVVPRYVPPGVLESNVSAGNSAAAIRFRMRMKQAAARQLQGTGYRKRLEQLAGGQAQIARSTVPPPPSSAGAPPRGAQAPSRGAQAPSQTPKGPSGSAPGGARPPVSTPTTKDTAHEHVAAQPAVTIERAVGARILGNQFPA